MRGLIVACAALAGCGGSQAMRLDGPTVEVMLDEGRAAERPLTPGQPFELLMRFDPRLPAWHPLALRFLLAQPGRIVFTIYGVTGEGNPGAAQKTIERSYGPELISSGTDGKFVVEDLTSLPEQRGPIFLGIYNPEKEGDARLWATSNDSGAVFQREADPTVPLSQTRVKRTPVVRLSARP